MGDCPWCEIMPGDPTHARVHDEERRRVGLRLRYTTSNNTAGPDTEGGE